MSVAKYRKELLERIEKEAQERPTFRDFLNETKSRKTGREDFSANKDSSEDDEVSEASAIIRDEQEAVEVRITALNGISYEIGQNDGLISLMFELLRNVKEPVELRLAVLGVLQLGEFNSFKFRARRPEYMEVLRTLVDDQDITLRQQAVGILAVSKDEYIQRRLLEGLRNESEPLVTPEKAIQLLGYDIHTEYFPLLQDIVKDPPNLLAKNEAVRLLATDADSKDLLAEILQDKNESKKVRQTSAIALQSIAPAEFRQEAERIIFDDDEYEDIRATCINAIEDSLNPVDGTESLRTSGSNALLEKIEHLKENASSEDLKRVANRYLLKHKK